MVSERENKNLDMFDKCQRGKEKMSKANILFGTSFMVNVALISRISSNTTAIK